MLDWGYTILKDSFLTMNTIGSLANQLTTQPALAEQYGLATQKQQAVDTKDKLSQAKPEHEQVSANDAKVSLSPRAQRAQKIESMAQDFFANGSFDAQKLPKLIQRLHQDGILSDGQLNRLSQAGFDIPTPEANQADLKQFIETQRSQLGDDEGDQIMGRLLDDAQSVLNQMDQAGSKQTSQTAARVSAQLSVFINADVDMSEQDRQQWQTMRGVMQLASSMGESQQDVGQLKSYLALAR